MLSYTSDSSKNVDMNPRAFINVTMTSSIQYCEIGPDRAQTFLCSNERIKNQLRPFIWLKESAPDQIFTGEGLGFRSTYDASRGSVGSKGHWTARLTV